MWNRARSIAAALALSVAACGGAGGGHPQAPGPLTADQIDADPMALLPGSPIAVAQVDAKAFFSSASLGAQVAKLAEQMVPLGAESGFEASRDVDRVVAGAYGTQGADVVAVVSGRFDDSKITAAAAAHESTKGGPIVQSEYAGRHVFAIADGAVTMLTPKTALAGTQAALRRALDRVQDGSAKRDVPQWMQDTLATPGAAAAVAVDLEQPGAAAALGSVPLAAAKGMKTARVLADFKPPGMHVALTVEYVDAASATAAANNLRSAVTVEGLAAMTGLAPKLQQVAIAAADTNVQASFGVDDASLRKLLLLVPQLVKTK